MNIDKLMKQAQQMQAGLAATCLERRMGIASGVGAVHEDNQAGLRLFSQR